METVSDWFAWRADSKSQSVEDQNARTGSHEDQRDGRKREYQGFACN